MAYDLWSVAPDDIGWHSEGRGRKGTKVPSSSPIPSVLLQFVHAFRLHTKRSLWLSYAWQTGKSRDGRGKLHDESPSVCTLFLSVALLLLTSCFCCDSCWNRSMMMCMNPSDGLLLNKNSQGWQQSVDSNDTMELIAMCCCYYCYLGDNKVWIYGSYLLGENQIIYCPPPCFFALKLPITSNSNHKSSEFTLRTLC